MIKLTIKATALHTAISDALNFASPAIGVPIIESVRLETVTDTGPAGPRVSLIGVGTDRFTLGISRVDADGDTGLAVTIASDDAKNVARIAKTARKDSRWRDATIEHDTDANTVIFRFSSGETITVTPIDSDYGYPKWRQLMPADDSAMQTSAAGVGIDPLKLAQFSKVAAAKSHPMAVFPQIKSSGNIGPVALRIGDDFVGLVMPVRAPGGYVFNYSVPGWLA